VLLTGASEGIGRALALRLARPGAHLALLARNRERLESLARECEALGAATLVLPADIGVPAQCAAAVQAAAAAFGGLDVLVSNAGATMWARFDALADDAIFADLIQLNYLPTVHLVRAALPLLAAGSSSPSRAWPASRVCRSARPMPAASMRWLASSSRCASSSRAAAST
jgi:NAD(P)-dependent dehydrogenase (short-subunit alcohol dehydrogenase family)